MILVKICDRTWKEFRGKECGSSMQAYMLKVVTDPYPEDQIS